jgi:hypothetical protein
VKLGLPRRGEKHRLQVLENRALREIFGPKEEDITQNGSHNEKLNNFYSLLNVNRMINLKKIR